MKRAGVLGFLPWLLLTAAAARGDDRPNVVWIMADDLNVDLGCYHHPLVRSPQIDRLAARGVRFERAYCNYPVCNPSRTSMLSGRYATTTGVIDNVTPPRSRLGDVPMLPEHFRRHGYQTRKVGKIFHTGTPFEDPRSWDLDVRETAEAKNPPAHQVVRKAYGGIVLDADDAETWDGQVARTAAAWLAEWADTRSPFFLACGFRRPHTPYIAPRRYFDLYPLEATGPPPEPADHLAAIPPRALTYAPGSARPSADDWREIRRAYYASTSFMDAQVGVVLDAIDRAGLWDRTIVVFTSDHGYHLGEHGGLHHKMTLFEQGVRVPLIVAAPRMARGATARGIVELIDLYPTLTDLCGLPAPGGLEGTSFVPLLNDPRDAGKAAAFAVVGRVPLNGTDHGGGNGTALDPTQLGRTVRTDRFRYTEWFDGTRQLYDHDADPHEFLNLAGAPRFAAEEAVLRELLRKVPTTAGQP